MAGKPRHIPNRTEPDTRFQEFTNNAISIPLRDRVANSTNTISKGSLMRSRYGVFTGANGNIEDSLNIASGILNLVDDSNGAITTRRVIHVNPESGLTDTLDGIEMDGNELPYQELVLLGVSGDVITVTHDGTVTGTERKILCPGDIDFTLSGDEMAHLIYDGSVSKWVLSGTIGSSVTLTSDDADLISYQKLNGNVLDSANDNDGTVTGTDQYATGKALNRANGAFDFDGSSYVQLDGDTEANFDKEHTDAFSVAFWIKTGGGSNSNFDVIIGKSDDLIGVTDSGFGFTFGNSSQNWVNFALNDDSSNQFVVRFSTGSLPITSSSWTHVVGTYDGSSNQDGLKIYIDGSLDATGASSAISNTILNNKELTLGGESDGGSLVNFDMDEFQFWNRELDISEIEYLYNSGSGRELSATGGGGGDVTFPIEPTVSDEGNTTGAKTIDLSSGDGHVYKMTLTGDVTLSFSNYPASGDQREWEIEYVQDGTGGHTITHPAEVVETVSIASGADTTTIITYRTNDGGTTVHAIPALRGSISLSGSNAFATKQLDNLSNPTLNTDLDVNTFDINNVDRLEFTADSGDVGSASKPTILADASGDMVLNVATNDDFQLKVNNTQEYSFSASAASFNANQINGTGAILPDSDATYDLGSDALSYDSLFIGKMRLSDTQSNPNTASDDLIQRSTTAMQFNLDDATHSYQFYWNGTNKFKMGPTDITGSLNLTLGDGSTGGVLTLNDISTDPSANGQIQRNGTDVKVYTGGAAVNLSNVATFPTVDTNSIVQGSVDNTKKLRFEVDGFTTGNTRVITPPDSDINLAGTNIANTWSQAQTFDNVAKLEMRTDITADSTGYDIGDSTNYFDDIFLERVRFPANNAMVQNAFNIGRVSVDAVDSLVFNAPTDRNIVFTENNNTMAVFNFVSNYLDLQEDGGLNQIRISPTGGNPLWSISKSSGGAALYTCSDGHSFTGDVTLSNDLTVSDNTTFGSTNADTVTFTAKINSDMGLVGGNVLKSNDTTEIGLQVTNESITVGTEGTLQIPHISGSSSTAAAADADFGDKEGCIGIYTNTTNNTHVLVVRQDDGNWAGVTLTDNTLT